MFWNPHDSDEEEDPVNPHSFGGRDGFVALIDCRPSMFQAPDSGYKKCIAIVESIVKNKIVNSEKDLIGAVFYNTLHSPKAKLHNSFDELPTIPKQTAVFIPMMEPSADMVKTLKSVHDSEDFLDFDNKYGHTDDCNYSDALWLCLRMFSRCGYKLQSTQIILFTDNDLPHAPNTYEYQRLFTKAKDFLQSGLNIVLIPMVDEFDGDKFYKEFLCTAMNIENPDSYTISSANESQEALMQRILKKDFRKKVLYHLKMHITDTLALSVNLYSFLRKTKYPKQEMLLRDTNETIQTKRSYMCSSIDPSSDRYEFKKPLLPGDQRKYQMLGGEKISFNTEEIANMKHMLDPGIKILGFKPLSKYSSLVHLRPCLFVYPNEEETNGSTTVFRALWEKCLEKEKVAFCIITMRRKSSPKLAMLIPQEKTSNENDHIRYDGFRLEFVPYAADIRNLEKIVREGAEVQADEIEAVRKMIRKIRFNYNPQLFENPCLKTLYKNIEGIVFGGTNLDDYDITVPDLDYQDNKICNFVENINTIFGKDDPIEAAKKKRKADTSKAPKPKVPKTDEHAAIDHTAIIQSIQSGNVGKLTVALLKAYLQQCGTSGISKLTKPGLIAKIKEIHSLE